MNGQFDQASAQRFIDEAFDAAQQVQRRARQIQTESRLAPQRSPVEGAARAPMFDSGNLFWAGLGAVAALGLAYVLIKRGE